MSTHKRKRGRPAKRPSPPTTPATAPTPTRRETTVGSPRLERLDAVQARVGLSRSTLYTKMKAGTFPAAVKIGPRVIAWNADAVTRWIEDQLHAGEADE